GVLLVVDFELVDLFDFLPLDAIRDLLSKKTGLALATPGRMGVKSGDDTTQIWEFPDVYWTLSATQLTTSPIEIRSCSVVSRSRTATFRSSSESGSTVTQNGVPISSCRR